MKKRGGTGWGRALLIVGAGFSLASNAAHTMLYPRPDGVAVAGWRALDRLHPDYAPGRWALAVSILWPILLFMVIEAMARTNWPGGFWSWAARFGGLIPVGTVAAVVSYNHMSELLLFNGSSEFNSAIGPIAIDGAMLMGTVILLLTSATDQPPRKPLAERVADTRASLVAVRQAATAKVADTANPVADTATATANITKMADTATATANITKMADTANITKMADVADTANITKMADVADTATHHRLRPAVPATRITRKVPATTGQDAVVLAWIAQPEGTVADLAERLGVPKRTAERRLTAARSASLVPTNGHRVDSLVSFTGSSSE
jgi:hypothetical protein